MHLEKFENIIQEIQNPMYRTAFIFTRDEASAKDIVQEAVIKIWKNMSKLDEIDNIKAWALRITKNICIDHKRREKMSILGIESAFSVEANVLSPERRTIVQDQLTVVHRALDTLSEKQKEAMILREIEGYTYQEIADIMDENINQIKILIHRGRTRLKSFIEKENNHGIN
jgi:RNA polymerase sigma-70 factor (ECF subfamily)